MIGLHKVQTQNLLFTFTWNVKRAKKILYQFLTLKSWCDLYTSATYTRVNTVLLSKTNFIIYISNCSHYRFYATQKKTLELNPRHPLVKELRRRVETDKEDKTTADLATVLFETATLRSGYTLKDTAAFAERIEKMLRLSMDVSLDEQVIE